MHRLIQWYSSTARIRLCICAVMILTFAVLSPNRAHAVRSQAQRFDAKIASTDFDSHSSLQQPITLAAKNVSKAEVAAAQKFGEGLSKSKWVEHLGPLAPVALSPFFGIACLSGMALYGSEHVSADNPFLGEGSALRNPVLFWTFVVLTILTSIPRLTKVSKPFAQAMDQVETWAGIITLLVLKFVSGIDEPTVEPDALVLQAGFFSASAETLLMVASVINIVVINMVKFFFEILIWITPVPFLDAIFEVANKGLCAGLMAVYAWSPTVATIINLVMFGACLLVFSWVKRREIFFRSVIVDPILSMLFPKRSMPDKSELVVFPKKAFGPFKTRARCVLTPSDSGWTLTQRRLFRAPNILEVNRSECRTSLQPGFFTNAILIEGQPNANLSFSQRYKSHLPELANQLGVSLQETRPANGSAQVEFA